MPIPNLLVAPSLVAAAADAGGDLGHFSERAQGTLERLSLQRQAFLDQLPQAVLAWTFDGSPAPTAFATSFELLTGRERPLDVGDLPQDDLVPLPARIEAEELRARRIELVAIRVSADRGIRSLARGRRRLSATARKLERVRASAHRSESVMRIAESAARLAAATAALAASPIIARDGGIDRRFIAALRYVSD